MSAPDEPPHPPRSVELEVEVPGTPEEVWEAIATGPGITAWLHPTEVEQREGGGFSFDTGSGRQEGTVTGWDPPHRFAQEVRWQPAGDAPASRLATEWHVQARAGGTCVVRMVMSGFGSQAGWDEELEGIAAGMRAALATLRLYRTHFPGQRGAWIRAAGTAPGPPEAVWARLTGALGLADATPGAAATSGPDAPALSGVVERVAEDAYGRTLLLRIDRPAPGLASLVVGQRGRVSLEAALYGDQAAAVAAREQPAWRSFLQARPATGAGRS
jgi:uncharacterized protein YndB with AHSA1/START domain